MAMEWLEWVSNFAPILLWLCFYQEENSEKIFLKIWLKLV